MSQSLRIQFTVLVLVTIVLVSWGGQALAQSFPAAQNCTATLVTPGLQPLSMFLVPNGSGTPLSGCFDSSGNTVNALINVTLRDGNNMVAANVPASSVRLEYLNSPLAWCSSSWYPPPAHAPNLADAASNAAGQTMFSLAYHGGGWIMAPIQVWVLEVTGAWTPIPTVLNVFFNSADINGDLVVNLIDVSLFAGDYYSGTQYRSDFNFDGAINLTDVNILATHYGTSCP
ncbi:MAG: hypothetical protein KAH56_06300 [Candidatus Krumholzibacteria bacterium]|nr:hypothetical protein [Candidatus Krumholzibacteria bacterium]